jgi:hypothetical protein
MFLETTTQNIDTKLTILLILSIIIIILLIIAINRLSGNKNNKIVENRTIEQTLVKPMVVESEKKKLSIEDIKDEDMMVAALIATIDYTNETKKDVRLVSIKQMS